MRLIITAMIMLSVSTAVVHAGAEHNDTKIQPNYGYYMHMQAPIGRPPTEADKKIEKDNELLDLPAGHDKVTGADQLESQDNVLAKKIGQENARGDREVTGICQGC
jgi:hypothetical protein